MDAHTVETLKNRIILLEKRLSDQKTYCAQLYLKYVVTLDQPYDSTYGDEIDRLCQFQDELKLVRNFLNVGGNQ